MHCLLAVVHEMEFQKNTKLTKIDFSEHLKSAIIILIYKPLDVENHCGVAKSITEIIKIN